MTSPNGWTSHKLGDLFDFKNGLNAEKERYGQGTKFINVMDIFNHDILYCGDIKGEVQASDKHIQDYLVKNGDILFNRTSEIVEEIAFSAVYMDNAPVVFGGFVIRARPTTNKLLPEYCVYLLLTDKIRRELIRRSQGVVRANIGQGDLRLIPLSIPPKAEQKIIADILSTWDKAIEQLTALIKAKHTRKKNLMYRLLTGKLRLPEFANMKKWQEYELSEFLIPTFREVAKPSQPYLSIGIRSHCKGTFQKPDTDPANNAMDKLYVVKENDLIVNITFAWEGAIALVPKKDDGGYVSHRFPTYTFNEKLAISEFFKYAVTTKSFRAILELISPGGAGRNRVLSKKDFLKIKWFMPSVEEQKSIATILSAVDTEISQLEQKLANMIKQKKGLMQQLLTGKKRVNLKCQEAA